VNPMSNPKTNVIGTNLSRNITKSMTYTANMIEAMILRSKDAPIQRPITHRENGMEYRRLL
jgi:hypothetical protein